ncbi:MAG TPA: hypothetical protein VIP08_00115 [Phenylobacterium sp.]|uniref:hypothetical protein n=1 Tax=Phenylobacterium sp. TaxID=1871053 RepID=UPI002F9338C1
MNTQAFDPTDIGAVVDAMYAMISGPAGPRDWALQAEIFHPDARQMRTWLSEDLRPQIRIMGQADYQADVQSFFDVNAFYEVEIARKIDIFGAMAHVWSAYEAKTSPDDDTPERRGINSIQLFREADGRWRIISMIWDNERQGLTLPSFE